MRVEAQGRKDNPSTEVAEVIGVEASLARSDIVKEIEIWPNLGIERRVRERERERGFAGSCLKLRLLFDRQKVY